MINAVTPTVIAGKKTLEPAGDLSTFESVANNVLEHQQREQIQDCVKQIEISVK